jgi:hypothetical protein
VDDSPINIELRGNRLGTTNSFKYVGSKLNSSSNMSSEISARLQAMATAFRKVKVNLLLNRNLPKTLRLRGYVAFVNTSALYGCATWHSTESDVQKLQSLQYRQLRAILGYSGRDHISYVRVIQQCRDFGVDILPIGAAIIKARLSYFGHVCRMDSRRLPKILFHSKLVNGKGRKGGGQELNYKTTILKDLASFNMLNLSIQKPKSSSAISKWEWSRWEHLEKLTKDRDKWRFAVKTSGVYYYMTCWYKEEAKRSNVRHKKTDGDKFVPTDPLIFSSFPSSLIPITVDHAINSGAVTVGRGLREGRTRQELNQGLYELQRMNEQLT